EAIIIKISQNEREKIIANTPSAYAYLIEKSLSYEPNQRPTLDQILIKLENLSEETTIEFITNKNVKSNKQIVQSVLNNEDSLEFFNRDEESSDNICESQIFLDNKIESNNDANSKNDITRDSALDEISKNLNVEFITTQSISNYSERSNSFNNTIEIINVNNE
ncbi:24051_t:CDS:2, partial [Racocetra persica]